MGQDKTLYTKQPRRRSLKIASSIVLVSFSGVLKNVAEFNRGVPLSVIDFSLTEQQRPGDIFDGNDTGLGRLRRTHSLQDI